MNEFSNYFVIVRVAGDQIFVVRKRRSWKIFEQVITVACLKNQISLETNCAEVSFYFFFFAKIVSSF